VGTNGGVAPAVFTQRSLPARPRNVRNCGPDPEYLSRRKAGQIAFQVLSFSFLIGRLSLRTRA
jgi:hypothetical protein